MRGTTRPRPTIHPTKSGINAVVWIEPRRALLVRGAPREKASLIEFPIPDAPAATPPALADLAHQIGDVDRVLVLGNDELRTALEREIVAIGHRPETIREAWIDGPVDESTLVARLRRLI